MFKTVQDYPKLATLESYADFIVHEHKKLANAHPFRNWPEKEKFDGDWKVFGLYHGGRKMSWACNRACITNFALETTAEALGTEIVMAGFSTLKAGSNILPHFDDVDTSLRIHLGVSIPDGDCGFEVEGQRIKWEPGKLIVFDPRLKHRAWNLTSNDRTVLLVDFKKIS